MLPFLLGDQLVARVDLKSDRQAGALRVQAAYLEDGHDPHYVSSELADELWLTADWLGLDRVQVVSRGDLSRDLQRAIAQRGADVPADAARGEAAHQAAAERIRTGPDRCGRAP